LRAVLATARRIGADLPLEQRGFVHVSSAGGLFEGQVACGRAAKPAPLRPYGEGKLAQERLVRADDSLGQRHILRPSSAYGYARGARKGLIATLIAAAVRSRPATIMGALTTQRDYVYAPDIGRFIAARVLELDPVDAPVETSLLASGRPTAVFEIIRLIESRFDAPLLLQIDPRPENARDNTFLPSGLPAGFRPTRLVEGVALTATALAADRYTGAAV
jgi:UDP-glucose 4-epimerase